MAPPNEAALIAALERVLSSVAAGDQRRAIEDVIRAAFGYLPSLAQTTRLPLEIHDEVVRQVVAHLRSDGPKLVLDRFAGAPITAERLQDVLRGELRAEARKLVTAVLKFLRDELPRESRFTASSSTLVSRLLQAKHFLAEGDASVDWKSKQALFVFLREKSPDSLDADSSKFAHQAVVRELGLTSDAEAGALVASAKDAARRRFEEILKEITTHGS